MFKVRFAQPIAKSSDEDDTDTEYKQKSGPSSLNSITIPDSNVVVLGK